MPKDKKIRIDQHLLNKGIAVTLKEAQGIILAGKVTVNGQKVDKVGQLINPIHPMSIKQKNRKFVSRGGEKLEGAINAFQVSFENRVCLDIGISTGGFSDCALHYGANTIIGVDVGYGQVANKLQQDNRVIIIERTNAKELNKIFLKNKLIQLKQNAELLEEIDTVIMDVSFISVCSILPFIKEIVSKNTDYFILIKPQFEAQKNEVGKGGIIQPNELRLAIFERTKTKIKELGFYIKNECVSPITGTQGNTEYFLHLNSI